MKFAYVMLVQEPVSGAKSLRPTQARQPEPPRGKILDADGNILAMSVRKKSLAANPRQIEDPWSVAQKLSPILNTPAPDLYKKLSKNRYFVWLERKLSKKKLSSIKDLDLRGLRFKPEYNRVYPQGRLAAQVLGFVGVDNRGLSGIEKQFDPVLSRASGDTSPINRTAGTLNDDVSVRLTIDQTIQHIVEEEMRTTVEKENPDNIMVVAMEPETGKIRALANWPSFNPNRFWDYKQSKRRNRVVSNVFEPGSTLKLMTLSIGLAEQAYSSSAAFNCKGYYYLPKARHTLHCYSKHGRLTIPEIIIQSCNVGTVKAANEIDPTTYYKSLRDFGFGNWTGVRLPGEASGRLRRPSEWSSMTQSVMAIGQGISTTALQLTNALASIVNGGKLMKPRIVASMNKGNGETDRVESFKIRRTTPEAVAADMKTYMEKVVTRGTGKQAALEEYQLAGKTGTAQKPKEGETGYYQDQFLASFIGFGPVGNAELVVSVIVDNPKKGRYGGEVAGPLFKRIMKRSLDYLDSQKDDYRVASH
ncbi:MAG: peptidoglycan D,D-transpeptidase FtsI family protein [bacterium]